MIFSRSNVFGIELFRNFVTKLDTNLTILCTDLFQEFLFGRKLHVPFLIRRTVLFVLQVPRSCSSDIYEVRDGQRCR